MKIKIKYAFLFLFGIAALCSSAKAQTGPPTASAMKAAEDMLIASGVDVQFDKSIPGIIAQYSVQVPEDKRAGFVKALTPFLTKYCSWEALKHDVCVMYAREFTEAELKQLTAFYKSPIGLKLLQKQPVINQMAMSIGQQSVLNHEAELKKLVEDAVK